MGSSFPFYPLLQLLLLLLLLQTIPFAAAQPNRDTSSTPNTYNFNPTTAIIILVFIIAFFFIGFFSIYISQCAANHPQLGGSIRRMNRSLRSRRTVRGLDPSMIQTFPTFIYSDVKGLKIGKGALECAVCLNEFEDDETLRLLPKCDHVFHPECIDAWLAFHTTCPVCRADLLLDSGQTTATTSADLTHVPDHEDGSNIENRQSEIDESQNQISIRVIEDCSRDIQPDVINPTQIPIQNRPARSRTMRPRITGKFPRSHSTGHSIVQPGENCERFTLRLPENVRKQIVSGKLNRTISCVSFPTGDGSVSGGSSRQGNRSGGVEGSSRWKNYQQFLRTKSDRWMFSMTPPFFLRTSSVKSPKMADGEGSSTRKVVF